MKSCKMLMIILLFAVPGLILAQNLHDYRTVDNATGLWHTNSNWQRFDGENWISTPSAPMANTAEQITVREGANLVINNDISLDQVVIENGAEVEIDGSNKIVTILDGPGDDFVIFGRLKVTDGYIKKNTNATVIVGNGGVYEQNTSFSEEKSIPMATWEDGSECLLTGTRGSVSIITSIAFSCMKQDFYNLTLDYGELPVGNYRTFGAHTPIDVRNTLKLCSGNLYLVTDGNERTLNANNLEVSGGRFVATAGYAFPYISIRNDFIINGGTVIVAETQEGVTRDYSIQTKNLHLISGTLDLNMRSSATKTTGRVYISGSFHMSGGVLQNTPGLAQTKAGMYFNGSGEQSFEWSGGVMQNNVETFFYYKTAAGGPTGLNETYAGTTAQQTVNGTGGSGLPTGFAAWPSSGALLKDLVINNPDGVTLSTHKTVNRSLLLEKGVLNLNSKTFIMASDTSIMRSGGNLSAAPTFNPRIDIGYLPKIGSITTSYELPQQADYVRNFTVSDSTAVILAKDVTVGGDIEAKGIIVFDGHIIHVPGEGIRLGGSNSIYNFSVRHVNEPATYGDGEISIARKWNLTGISVIDLPGVPYGELTYDFYWPSDLDGGADLTGELSLWRHNGSSWTLVKTGIHLHGTEDGLRTIKLNMMLPPDSKGDELNEYTITGASQTLPVVLSSFTVSPAVNGLPLIKWVTESETNLLGFYVYRHDTPELVQAERISGLIEGGNSSYTQYYSFMDDELAEFGEYYYWLQSLDLDATQHFFGPINYYYHQGVQSPEMPLVSGIHSIYPNPFNPHLTIRYGIEKASPADLRIYNQRGQLILRKHLGEKTTGTHSFLWDGKDSYGTSCSSGVYLIRMNIGGEVFSRKVSLLK